MKISVITSVYNNVHDIEGAIASVLAQRGVDLELIVVDGGSTDGTLNVIERYSSRIHRFVTGPDRGIYDGLNRGIALATGDYVGFLHSDDLFAGDDALARLSQPLRDRPDHRPAALYGDLQYVDKTNPARVLRHWRARPFSHAALERGWMPPHPALYVRRDLLERIGGFDVGLRISADYKFILQLFQQPGLDFTYVPGVVVKMRSGGASNRSLKAIGRKMHEDFQVMRSEGLNPWKTMIWKNLSKVPQILFPGRRAA